VGERRAVRARQDEEDGTRQVRRGGRGEAGETRQARQARRDGQAETDEARWRGCGSRAKRKRGYLTSTRQHLATGNE